MSTITPTPSPAISTVLVPEPAHPVSELIDATETLYRLTVEEYEQIAGFLDDDRVELIDGYLAKKIVRARMVTLRASIVRLTRSSRS